MSWFPKFPNIAPAAIAAAIAIPALLILYFLKLRRREMPVSSTLLWKKAILDLQVNAPFQKLRRNLLLLLQLLLLLLLILALSRPVSNYTPGPGKTCVILIDRSASMAARDQEGDRSRLAEAKRQARELVAAMGKESTAMVIAFDDSAEMVQAFTSDANLLNSAIDRIKQTDRKTDLKLAYQLAAAQFENYDPEQLRVGGGKEPPDVRLFSDGRVLDANQLSIKAKVTYEKIGSETAGNVAIVALSAKRTYERPTQVQVFARLSNYGPEPVDTPVELSVNGEKIETQLQSTVLLPERWDEKRDEWIKQSGKTPRDSVEFKLELTQAAVIKIEHLHRQGDSLAADDVAQVVVPPPKLLSVLLVTDGNYFLERAVRSLGLKKPDVVRPQSYENQPPSNYDVVIFDNFKPSKLPPVGNFLWFGVVPDGIKTKIARSTAPAPPPTPAPTSKPAGGAAAAPPPPASSALIEDVGILDWKRDHPILKDLNLSRLYVEKALKLDVPFDQQILVDGFKGPLVVLDREPKSTHLIVAFDSLQSTWPLRPSFPIFLFNAMQYLAIGSDMDVRQSVDPGTAPRIPRPNLLRAGEDLKKVTLRGPGGTQDVPVPPTGDFVLPPLNQVGLYSTDPAIPQFEQIAVNLLDPNESNVLPGEKPPGDIGVAGETGPTKRRLELWWWLAVGALALLMIEWWVYTRRVHL